MFATYKPANVKEILNTMTKGSYIALLKQRNTLIQKLELNLYTIDKQLNSMYNNLKYSENSAQVELQKDIAQQEINTMHLTKEITRLNNILEQIVNDNSNVNFEP